MYERRVFAGCVVSDSVKEKMCDIESEFGDRATNQYVLLYAKKLCELYENGDEWEMYIRRYLAATPKQKRINSEEMYMYFYGNLEYAKEKYKNYVSSQSKSLKKAYDTGNKTATFDHFFPQYWIAKGMTHEEAIAKVNERKNRAYTNSNSAQKKLGNTRPNQLAYWLAKGCSEEEAKLQLSKRQTTFSLDVCIEKYGFVAGYQRWLDRQTKWMDTLNAKSDDEKCRITKLKIKSSKGSVSKQENLLYSLIDMLGLEQQVAVDNYVYDMAIGNKIIEYNGDFWHCNPKLFKEDKQIFDKTAKQIWEYDAKKNGHAESKGYSVLVVWETEFLKDRNDTIDRCRKFLNG